VDNSLPVVADSNGRKALLVDGVVQSVEAESAASGYWQAMLPENRPAATLVLGVGGGTIVHLLREAFGEVRVIGVDDSPAVLELGRAEFGLAAANLSLVEGDAFAYVHSNVEQFDFIVVDLYRGGRLARGVLALPFLRTLASRLREGGTVAFNLFRDEQLAQRVARLERVFDRARVVEVAANAVFHGRPRSRYR
jgi:spermidine synthase